MGDVKWRITQNSGKFRIEVAVPRPRSITQIIKGSPAGEDWCPTTLGIFDSRTEATEAAKLQYGEWTPASV